MNLLNLSNVSAIHRKGSAVQQGPADPSILYQNSNGLDTSNASTTTSLKIGFQFVPTENMTLTKFSIYIYAIFSPITSDKFLIFHNGTQIGETDNHYVNPDAYTEFTPTAEIELTAGQTYHFVFQAYNNGNARIKRTNTAVTGSPVLINYYTLANVFSSTYSTTRPPQYEIWGF